MELKYNTTTAELIDRAFKGYNIKACNDVGDTFHGGGFSFLCTGSYGEHRTIKKDAMWCVVSIVPPAYSREFITTNSELPQSLVLDFLEFRKEWFGKVKIEMRITPVGG
jgi:hypothetical protein